MRLNELWYPAESGAHEKLSGLQRIVLLVLFWPVSHFYGAITRLRRWLYRLGVLRSWKSPVPVIVVGNISVGGTGKTPLVIALVELLKVKGWQPGIVSRGYGGDNRAQPLTVHSTTPPSECGDEPLLITQRTELPVCVCPNRTLAVQHLLSTSDVDVIVCDDGLQHYALQRDIEIVVVDHQRQHGNGRLLPSGPLREPVSRLTDVDFVVESTDNVIEEDRIETDSKDSGHNRYSYRRQLETVVRLDGTERQNLQALSGKRCHVVAGIGHPARFFEHLESIGVELIKHPFPDHHRYSEADVQFADDLPVVMTEKDAVKCRLLSLAPDRCWVVELHAELSDDFISAFINKADSLR